jgi:hypothetical protein
VRPALQVGVSSAPDESRTERQITGQVTTEFQKTERTSKDSMSKPLNFQNDPALNKFQRKNHLKERITSKMQHNKTEYDGALNVRT